MGARHLPIQIKCNFFRFKQKKAKFDLNPQPAVLEHKGITTELKNRIFISQTYNLMTMFVGFRFVETLKRVVRGDDADAVNVYLETIYICYCTVECRRRNAVIQI